MRFHQFKRSYDAYIAATEGGGVSKSPERPVIKKARCSPAASPCPQTEYSEGKNLKIIDRRESPSLITDMLNPDPSTERSQPASTAAKELLLAGTMLQTAQEEEKQPAAASQKSVAERFADAQAEAKLLGQEPSLKWVYDQDDELAGATCGTVSFSREELVELSACWAGRR